METEAVQISILLPEVELDQFDVLEVYRSRSGPQGPYENITGNGAQPARIPSTVVGAPPSPPVTGPFINAVGKTLTVKVKDQELTFTLSGSDPLTMGDVATQITTQSGGLLHAFSYVASLVIDTTDVGDQARLEVLGGSLAGLLGLPVNQISYGMNASLVLVAGQSVYTFTDPQGSRSFYYKTRFRNRLTNSVGEFSEAMSPLAVAAVVETVIGTVSLIDSAGKAISSREILVYSRLDGNLIDGRVVAGLAERRLTDENGFTSFTLVRGLPITVAIAGTDLVRDVVVPTDPSVLSFNLFSPELGSNDLFKVQVPNVPFATRRSL